MIRHGRNTSFNGEPFVAVGKSTSLIQRCPKPRNPLLVTASPHEAFGRLELCELETLTHSS